MVLIFGQIKEGFKIWRKGWLSFILAVILLSIVFIVILIPALVGVATIASFIEGDIIFTGVIIGYAVISLAMMFNFVVIGTMCGLGKELIEIEDTRAENTLHYIKNYGLRFAAIGLIIATVVFGPFIVIGLVLSFLNILPGASLDLATGIVLGILIFLIAFFLFAPFTLSIPACLIEDIGPIESIKTSFQAFRKNPKTISVLLALFIIIFVALLAFPVIGFIIGLVQTPFAVILASVLGTFAVIAFFVSLFVILPVMCITFTKLYYDYKIPRKEEVSEEESPISLF
ncbi:MAG: hypothetical protein KAI34_05455 [Candidatus Lokiarchaeota archaeon]|nr:hypothetical protein [Candidatus Lokiarchaeota archaeon]